MTTRALRLARAAAVALPLAAAAPAYAAPPPTTWEAAEAAGWTIGEVRVVRDDVFDLSTPEESHLVGRAANLIHVATRESVVRSALLIAAGEPVRAALVRESERRLRSLPWLLGAEITPEPSTAPGAVDALVRTHDGWSLSLSLKFLHTGGENQWRVWAEDDNLLGWGKTLQVSHEENLDRTSNGVLYRDPLLFGSPWQLELSYEDLSDGTARLLSLRRPFERLDAPWSAGFRASRREFVETLYDRGRAVYSFPAELAEGSLFASRRARQRGRAVWRAGLEYRADDATYGELSLVSPDDLPPPDLAGRRVRGLLATLALLEDDWRTCRNLRTIDATEDLNLGWEASLAAGPTGGPLGGDAEGFLGEFSVRRGWAVGAAGIVLGAASGRARFEDGRAYDALASAELTAYARALPLQTIATRLALDTGSRLDPESLLYIGGSDGLRGYPNHFRAGEDRWLLSVEDRVITPWRLWGIAQVGFVAYADAGAVTAPAGGWMRTYADVGAGLRFGNLKGTTARVVSLTVAVPLVREEGVAAYEVIAGNAIRF